MARFLVYTFLLLQSLSMPSARARALDELYSKCTLQVGGKTLSAYIADNDNRRSDGLMFIKSLKQDTGMLFVFEAERPLGFWMKNTVMPLSIGFFDEGGKLLEVLEMVVADSIMDLNPPTYFSKKPAQFALEMSPSWFKKNKIPSGAALSVLGKCSSPLLAKHSKRFAKSGR